MKHKKIDSFDDIADAAAERLGLNKHSVTETSIIDRDVLLAVGQYLSEKRGEERPKIRHWR